MADEKNEFEGKNPEELAAAARQLAEEHHADATVKTLLLLMADALTSATMTEDTVRGLIADSLDRVRTESRRHLGGGDITAERLSRGLRMESERLRKGDSDV